MELTAVLIPAEESIDKALANLEEATSLYLEEFCTG